jgi:hypothetical protein
VPLFIELPRASSPGNGKAGSSGGSENLATRHIPAHETSEFSGSPRLCPESHGEGLFEEWKKKASTRPYSSQCQIEEELRSSRKLRGYEGMRFCTK